MAVIWRGMGIAIPISAAIVAGILAIFFDDVRLGNLGYIGWVLLITVAPTVLVGLASFGGEESGSWAKHSLFFVPAVLWVPILAGLGGYFVASYEPASEQALGTWRFAGCVSECDPAFAQSLRTMEIVIGDESITVGNKTRPYEVATQKASHLTLRYTDNGDEEEMMMMGEDRFVGYIQRRNGAEVTVGFERIALNTD